MKLEEIKEIKICYTEGDVNKHLKKDFHVKKILSTKTNLNGEEIMPCFILGKG